MAQGGFTFGGVHSSTHGVVVVDAPGQPILSDVRMGEWSRGRQPGAVLDTVTFGASAWQMVCVCEGADAGDLQEKLDDVAAWLNPLNGPKLLVPDWMVFTGGDAGLSRGWYCVLNGPILEIQMGGRHAVKFNLHWKVGDPAKYGAVEKTVATTSPAASGSKTCAALGSLASLPVVTVEGAEGVTVTLGDGTREVVVTLPESGVVRLDSRLREVAQSDGDEGWEPGYGCVVAPGDGPVAWLELEGAEAAVTWSAGAGVDVEVRWRDRWL